MNRREPTATESWIETSRGRLFARRWQPHDRDTKAGSEPPIVLFHESLGCVSLWRRFPAALAQATGREVIAYDRLGFGRSDPRDDKLATDFIREEAQTFFPRLREQLEFRRFIAFGHSVGGAMAAHCAALYAPDCEALVTESAQAFVEERTRAGIRDAEAAFAQPSQFRRLERYHGAKTRWVLDVWIQIWLSPAFADWSLDPVLPQIRCPTLALHGSDDEYGSTRHPETIARLVSGPSQLHVIPGAKHSPHLENPVQVADYVAEFIAKHYR